MKFFVIKKGYNKGFYCKPITPLTNSFTVNRSTLRRTLLNPTLKRLGTATTQKSSKKFTSPKKMSETVTQETFSSNCKRKQRSKSPSNRELKSSGCTHCSPMRNSKLSDSVKLKPKVDFSPTRIPLKTRYDFTSSINEEVKIASPLKKEPGSITRSSLRTTYTLSSREEDDLAISLRELIDLDKELERSKQSLALRPDFTLYDGFRVFDYDNNGNANLDDIIEAFETFGVHVSAEEASLFLIRFDLNKDGTLNYKEIWEALTPKEQKTAILLKNRSAKYPNGYYNRLDEFSTPTHQAFVKVMKLHIEIELRAEAIRQNHEYGLRYRYEDAFAAINQFGVDYITREDFSLFFKKFGFYATDLELDVLISRFDKDYDGKVSLQEFYEEFSPHSPLKV